MAFGVHWEWRGFGELPESVRWTIEALPLKFPDSQELTDEYLWIPGASNNVKLRFQDLKLKRLVDERGPFQRWIEDEAENFSFPLSPCVLEKLSRSLGVSFPFPSDDGSAGAGVGRNDLLRMLVRTKPRVSRVAVAKCRWQYELALGPEAATQDVEPVTVELADILSPEATTSVGLEHPDLDCLRHACESLGVRDHLRGLSYLEAVATWARGERVAGL